MTGCVVSQAFLWLPADFFLAGGGRKCFVREVLQLIFLAQAFPQQSLTTQAKLSGLK